MPTVKITS